MANKQIAPITKTMKQSTRPKKMLKKQKTIKIRIIKSRKSRAEMYEWNLERETRFELATFCLGSRHSTTELLPQVSFDCKIKDGIKASI